MRDADAVLKRYEARERAIVKERGRIATQMWRQNGSLVEILHYMFGVEKDPPSQAQIFGSPWESIATADKTIVTLWPDRRHTPANIDGFSTSDLASFIREGVIFPLIQNPRRYIDVPALIPIIEEFNPPCYFWRGNMVYSILSGGDENFEEVGSSLFSGEAARWKREALDHKVIRRAFRHRETWEPHHQRKVSSPVDEWGIEYLRDSFAFKYVNACTFLGEDFVVSVLSGSEPKVALEFLTTFHILTDHPITHAFLTGAGIDLTSPDWVSFLKNKSDYFCDDQLSAEVVSFPFRILAKPAFSEYMEMRGMGLESLPLRLQCSLSDLSRDELASYRSGLTTAAAAHEEWAERLPAKVGTVSRVLSISAYGVVRALGGDAITAESALEYLFSGILGDLVATKWVVKQLKKAKLEHMLFKMANPPEPTKNSAEGTGRD